MIYVDVQVVVKLPKKKKKSLWSTCSTFFNELQDFMIHDVHFLNPWWFVVFNWYFCPLLKTILAPETVYWVGTFSNHHYLEFRTDIIVVVVVSSRTELEDDVDDFASFSALDVVEKSKTQIVVVVVVGAGRSWNKDIIVVVVVSSRTDILLVVVVVVGARRSWNQTMKSLSSSLSALDVVEIK